MTRPLRSNFERGTSRWAVRRAQWRALGLTDADMERPKIAVVNTSSELSSCFSHLDAVARIAKDAIRAAGGVPFEIRTAAPSDFITSAGARGGYILPSRDLIANDIEVQVEGAQLDGMLLLASCDKTAPGQLMAAGRLDIPSIVAICGYQRSGTYRGEHMDIEELFLRAGHVAAGRVSVDELAEMSEQAVRGPGVCAGMGTANSMHIVSEALGMTLPGAAPVAAMSDAMNAQVRGAGARIVAMVLEDLRPRAIMTAPAFWNAAAAVMAVSGSINCIKHLQAIAIDTGCDVDLLAMFERASRSVPVLAAVRPNGEHLIEDFERAGGARALLARMGPIVDGSPITVTGRTMQAQLAGVDVADPEVIRSPQAPFSPGAAIVPVRGNLAPDAGIVKMGLGEGRVRRFSGPAVIYHSREEALDALARDEIRPGHVVVLRGMGVTGGPGMAMASALVFALDGRGIGEQVAVVTDGQLSGLVNKSLVVGEVSPESAVGGPLALVRAGDRITIDVDARTVDLEIDEAEFAARRAAWRPAPASNVRGWLSIYRRTVRPLGRGAVMTESDENAGPDRLTPHPPHDEETR